jgi:hypothetical protein
MISPGRNSSVEFKHPIAIVVDPTHLHHGEQILEWHRELSWENGRPLRREDYEEMISRGQIKTFLADALPRYPRPVKVIQKPSLAQRIIPILLLLGSIIIGALMLYQLFVTFPVKQLLHLPL